MLFDIEIQFLKNQNGEIQLR